MKITSLTDLITKTGGKVEIACDTEFEGLKTLTVQFAARIGNNIVVQVYSSPAVPPQPRVGRLKALLPPGAEPPGGRVVVRPGTDAELPASSAAGEPRPAERRSSARTGRWSNARPAYIASAWVCSRGGADVSPARKNSS